MYVRKYFLTSWKLQKILFIIKHLLRPCQTFPGRLHRLFACMDFPACRKSSVGKPIFYVFCVYFPCWIRGTWLFVSALYVRRARPEDGTWELRFRYRQHMCIARYQHVNRVWYVREVHARCEGTCPYRNGYFSRYRVIILSVLGNQTSRKNICKKISISSKLEKKSIKLFFFSYICEKKILSSSCNIFL